MLNSMRRKLTGWRFQVISILAFSWSIFQIITGWQPLPAIFQRTIHVVFAFSLIYLLYTSHEKQKRDRFSWDSWIMVALTVGVGGYVFWAWGERAILVGSEPPLIELIVSGVLIFLCLDTARRAAEWALPVFTIGTILYALFGENLPGVLSHKAYDAERILTSLFLSYDGIYGALTGISATFLFLFMLFGVFLRISGAGDFFINLASSLFGHVRGGPAKIAVVASSLFGMITGSVIANVSAVGQVTIPMMIRGGYRREFAGAVEACSGLGSQIMPPVMGGAVFIMMEILNTSYISICWAAILTAILYYFSLFMMIDFEAVKYQLKGIPKDQKPNFKKVFKGGFHFFIPPALLVYLLAFANLSESRAVFWAILSIPLVSWCRKSTRMGPKKIYQALQEGALVTLPVVAIVVNCSIISGMIALTGLGLNLSDLLIAASGNSLIVLLLITAIASLIVGLGLPIIVSYLLLAILVAPAMVKLGVPPMAAHLFIFFFALISDLTPPVAPGCFIAAGIAGGSPMKTAWVACRIGLVLYILPFFLVYNPSLMLRGSALEVIESVVTATVGVIALAAAIQMHMFRKNSVVETILLFGAAFLLIWPGWISDLLGFSLFFFVLLRQRPTFFIDLVRRLAERRAKAKVMPTGL
jgi:TRAP transporter 4TM/12TM fusion protein